ncbi:hypothetical protein SAMD00019534_111870, partial [Acytostelium subglobosum LB1]|uniref:hypothetical protein n=1 Tax=Acytostelium subglobosum LB1 TaxID=1410327 RepID=UPI0006449FFE
MIVDPKVANLRSGEHPNGTPGSCGSNSSCGSSGSSSSSSSNSNNNNNSIISSNGKSSWVVGSINNSIINHNNNNNNNNKMAVHVTSTNNTNRKRSADNNHNHNNNNNNNYNNNSINCGQSRGSRGSQSKSFDNYHVLIILLGQLEAFTLQDMKQLRLVSKTCASMLERHFWESQVRTAYFTQTNSINYIMPPSNWKRTYLTLPRVMHQKDWSLCPVCCRQSLGVIADTNQLACSDQDTCGFRANLGFACNSNGHGHVNGQCTKCLFLCGRCKNKVRGDKIGWKQMEEQASSPDYLASEEEEEEEEDDDESRDDGCEYFVVCERCIKSCRRYTICRSSDSDTIFSMEE